MMVAMMETTIDPMQPKRLEKNANISPYRMPLQLRGSIFTQVANTAIKYSRAQER
jgi:hypothetical protein